MSSLLDEVNREPETETEPKPVPPELAGTKRGKGPCPECGSPTRHKATCSHVGEAKPRTAKAASVPITDEMVMRAWLGAWVVFGILVWLFGRWFVKPDETVKLEPLDESEAKTDAALLYPLFVKYPVLFNVLAWVGTPIAIIRRVSAKLTVRKLDKKPEKGAPENATLRPVPSQG